MNILYGLAGVGYGHASRALLIVKHLEKKGHKVKIITYGDGYRMLKDDFDCMEVNGLDLVFEKGTIKKRATILKNLRGVPKNLLKWKKFYRLMRDFKPDLCISDMEPIVPILSRWYSLPLVSIDNQHALTNLKFKVPWKYMKDFIVAKKVINAFVRKADKFIVSSFSDAEIKKKNTVIIPPIVRGEVQKLKPKYGKKILVYISKGEEKSLDELRNLNEKFVVYGFDIKKKDGNLEFKTRETFLKDLKDCGCVIGTAGFSLMGEAIYLNKPYLAIPLKGHFEQISNALFLKESGLGTYSEKLNERDTIYFLYKLEEYKKKLKKYDTNQGKLFKTIDGILKKVK